MDALTHQAGHSAERTIEEFLSTRVRIGRQYGRPVEVTVRQALQQTPCLLLMGVIFGLVLFF